MADVENGMDLACGISLVFIRIQARRPSDTWAKLKHTIGVLEFLRRLG